MSEVSADVLPNSRRRLSPNTTTVPTAHAIRSFMSYFRRQIDRQSAPPPCLIGRENRGPAVVRATSIQTPISSSSIPLVSVILYLTKKKERRANSAKNE